MHSKLTALLKQIVIANLTHVLFRINTGNFASVSSIITVGAAGYGTDLWLGPFFRSSMVLAFWKNPNDFIKLNYLPLFQQDKMHTWRITEILL